MIEVTITIQDERGTFRRTTRVSAAIATEDLQQAVAIQAGKLYWLAERDAMMSKTTEEK